MDTEVLKIVGQVAGIGGLALGVFLLLFRDVIRKNIFPNLNKEQGYRLLMLIIILVWTIALAGIGGWAYVKTLESRIGNSTQPKEYQLSGVVVDDEGRGLPEVVVSLVGRPERDQTTTSGNFSLRLQGVEGGTVRLQVAREDFKPWNENVTIPNTGLRIQMHRVEPPPGPGGASNTDANNSKRTGAGNNRKTYGSRAGRHPPRSDDSGEKPPIITDQTVTRP